MDDNGVFTTEDGKIWIAREDGIEELEITIIPLPPELAAMRDAEEVVVDHWRATLVEPGADGVWDYEEIESPCLTEDWSGYEDFEPSSYSVN